MRLYTTGIRLFGVLLYLQYFVVCVAEIKNKYSSSCVYLCLRYAEVSSFSFQWLQPVAVFFF